MITAESRSRYQVGSCGWKIPDVPMEVRQGVQQTSLLLLEVD
jgi:hypothetical protein